MRGKVFRKLKSEDDTSRKTSLGRHAATVVLSVAATWYDPDTGGLRITGKNLRENDVVPLGASQSIEIQMHTPFKLIKPYGWDSVAEQMLTDAVRQERQGDIAAVLMSGDGSAHICIITQHRTVVRATVDSAIPKKRDSPTVMEAGTARFFEKTLSTLLRNFDFVSPRPVVLASPGFIAANFQQYIADQSVARKDDKLKMISRDTQIVHTSSGHIHSLHEVLKSPEITSMLSTMRYSQETKHFERFMDTLRLDDGRAWYGVSAVEKAIREGAVGPGNGLLLLSNSLFRSNDLAVRKKFVALVDSVRAQGGETHIMSSDHDSGQRLAMLGNIAAILSYPMYDLDAEPEEPEAAQMDGPIGENAEPELDSAVVAAFGMV